MKKHQHRAAPGAITVVMKWYQPESNFMRGGVRQPSDQKGKRVVRWVAFKRV